MMILCTALLITALTRAETPSLLLFDEPDFPALDVATPLPIVAGAVAAHSSAELIAELAQPCVLVWRHGSAFPSDAWSAFVQFLERGGSFLWLGGEPLTRPVTGEVGQRVVQPRTVSLLKELRLNQCERVPLQSGWVATLEPRFSDTKDFATEDGAPGSRDAVLHPFRYTPDKTAAVNFAIDRLRGRFAGGRWVFHLASLMPTRDELETLLARAAQAPVDLHVDPTFGCFHAGETPSLIVRLHRPRQERATDVTVHLEVRGGGASQELDVTLRGGVHATAAITLPGLHQPGLYRVTAHGDELGVVTTGFWVFDQGLFSSGSRLDFDGFTMRRDGKPEPVVGTTVMSDTVHRKFLFEPNAASWNDTFAELQAMGVNMVRTGMWSAFRKVTLDPNVVDEAWLRALEAYYLTAREHGIAVLFTFFAFLPETFGGANPYLDPRAIEGQSAYVAAVASRFAGAKEMLFDLINEPSFASAEHLWQCRPSGDRFEQRAFERWLGERYQRPEQDQLEHRRSTWQDVVRARWRLLPDEPIGLPVPGDFEERTVFENHRPYRARDYALFVQDAFADWARAMTRAIRDAGSTAPITVGQDEGGLFERPNPSFHAGGLDFTSIHTWWFNDHLLWDGLLAKAPRKPMLVSETGIMQRELLSGERLRTPDERARLLSRKLAYAFASGAFGVIQWCYDVNPYMASDNEVAIGLRRIDGSYKPEHRAFQDVARFIARNRLRFDAPRVPEVVVIMPSSDLFGPRGMQTEGTQRSVRILCEAMQTAVQFVSEHRARGALDGAKLIVLPACRGVAQECWSEIVTAVERGAVLLCSGWFEQDDAGLPASRLAVTPRPLAMQEAAGLRYPRAVFESAPAADHPELPRAIERGRGKIRHYPAPLEWAESCAAQLAAYDEALTVAGITHAVAAANRIGVLVRRIEFREATLVVIINERSDLASVSVGAETVTVAPQSAELLMLDARGGIVDRCRSP